ncbi:MAG TPA: ATP-binding protein [Nitrospirota bacterium]|nr:ATP-binding protein [Nitrospirota bacterium]
MPTQDITSNTIPVGELVTSVEQVSFNFSVNSVADKFFCTTDLDAVAVIDDESMPVGLVTRTKLLFSLFRRYGFELYGKHTIITLAEKNPLIIPKDKHINDVIDMALERPPQDIYDEIIVTNDDGTYRGLLSVKQLVIQQSNALAKSILQKEIASARAQELEKISQVKSQFLANVTHELRSPVNAILGLAELLRMAAEKNSMEQIKERLSFMITSATNLRTIITNILDLSKIEAGKMTVVSQPCNVTELVCEIAETARILVGKKAVSIVVTAPVEPIIIATDHIKLRQIITNLVTNAAKFTEAGAITMAIGINNGSLEIAVHDTGIGIKEEHLEKLFTAFGQIEDAKTKQYQGTGLGLTISKNLAELIEGTITVTSTFGKGSTFTLFLPSQVHERRGVLNHAD